MSSNYQGRGGRGRSRGGRDNYRGDGNYRGGGRSDGRGRGGHGGGGGGRGGHGGGGGGAPTLLNPCRQYTTTGSCQHGSNCRFAHILTLHKVVEASSVLPDNNNNQNNNYHHNNHRYNNNQQQKAAISSVSIWDMNGSIQIFTGSHDGFWRMWNTAGGAFNKQAETPMKGKVECLEVVSNSFLYCGYEAPSKLLSDVPVGMVNAWDLKNAAPQPLELLVNPQMLPYAHNQAVTAMAVGGGSGGGGDAAGAAAAAPSNTLVTGSRDGSIRLWSLEGGAFVLVRTLPGHAREVTGLILIPGGSLLWSSSTDGSIRIWDLSQTAPDKACQYCITRDTPGQVPPSISGVNNNNHHHQQDQQQQQQPPTGVGHTDAVTSLVAYPSPAGTFILSSSLDGSIKAWDSNTGACVAHETHGEGVVTMALANAPSSQSQQQQQPPPPDGDKGAAGQHAVLLIGLVSGNIACRNLVQTQSTPAFQLLFVLSNKYTAAHDGAVKAITPGPAATFYTGGSDGNLLVWQFTGDMRL